MAQNHSVPPMMAPTSSAELLQAQAELWSHAFAYLKSMALHSVIKLGIPTAIHRCGGTASLSELHAHLPLLVTSGVFKESEAGVYSLTPVSRLLVEDDAEGGRACLSPFAILATSPFHLRSSQRLTEWMENEEEDAAAETPFMMAHGAGFYGYAGRDLELAASRRESSCGEVFAGLASLVDVGGGDGTMAKAIAKAFPHARCTVLELPQLVGTMPVGGMVESVAGDMMEFIPPAGVVLLKFVLRNWSDEDCVRILKRAKEAISTREPKGKVVIIDTVAGSASSKQAFEAQVFMDVCMMMLTTGEVRDEEKWRGLFLHADMRLSMHKCR
ncbi:hypothetical protein PAHAL_1G077200 [Panicum hallii]|uniref:Uncharacterized protein n=1 Tax=Panicum hallii TaxID=206008 RepID=A0A2S3GMP6_9POAL|nr:hypothetical protein PAHAL_1G077200 [Panicum hallii]